MDTKEQLLNLTTKIEKKFSELVKKGFTLTKPLNHIVVYDSDTDNPCIEDGDIIEVYIDETYEINDHILVRLSNDEEVVILPDLDAMCEMIDTSEVIEKEMVMLGILSYNEPFIIKTGVYDNILKFIESNYLDTQLYEVLDDLTIIGYFVEHSVEDLLEEFGFKHYKSGNYLSWEVEETENWEDCKIIIESTNE